MTVESRKTYWTLIDRTLFVLMLVAYIYLGHRLAQSNDATRLLGRPRIDFYLSLAYLLIHFSLIIPLPVFVVYRLTVFCCRRIPDTDPASS